jgi:hypothetical protein
MIIPHWHGTTPARRAFGRDHVQHTITPGTTGNAHHGRSNHACTTRTGTTSLAQRAFAIRDRRMEPKRDERPRRPTDCRSATASAPRNVSKSQRSCARSGRLERRVGWAGCRAWRAAAACAHHTARRAFG